MPAEIEQQRVALMGQSSWLEYRAVCWDHGSDESGIIANWQSPTYKHWFDAKLDAVEHNVRFHPRHMTKRKSWAEILDGDDDAESPAPLLRRQRDPQAQHAI